MTDEELRDTWSRLVEYGTPNEDLDVAMRSMPELSVGIDDWVERLAKHYLRDLCQRRSYFKLVIGPYGSGKTHFLLALALKALEENFAVAFIKCKEGISLETPINFYQEIVGNLRLPGVIKPGVKGLFKAVQQNWRNQANETPDPEFTIGTRFDELEEMQFPFGRVAAAYLRTLENPALDKEKARCAQMWLNGEIEALSRKDREGLSLGAVPSRERALFGHRLLDALVSFIPNAGVHGLVLLVDESENMVNARGKALQRVLNTMRTLIDPKPEERKSCPLFCMFAAVPDIEEKIQMYQALQTRLSVPGQQFHEGSNSAARIYLEHLGQQSNILHQIGVKLLTFAEKVHHKDYNIDIQSGNIEALIDVTIIRQAEADSRRLFVKAWCNLLEEQSTEERRYGKDELQNRIAGVVEELKVHSDSEEEHP